MSGTTATSRVPFLQLFPLLKKYLLLLSNFMDFCFLQEHGVGEMGFLSLLLLLSCPFFHCCLCSVVYVGKQTTIMRVM